MAIIRPFKGCRPLPNFAAEVAAKPYDVLSSIEARLEAADHPLSFLHVGKPEIDLDLSIDPYDVRVYEKARSNLRKYIENNIFLTDPEPYLYIYSQTMGSHTQYGIVGCVSIQDYLNNVIKKHELTRKDKEDDRTNHVRYTQAHTGPVFLTYLSNTKINKIVENVITSPQVYDFVAQDGIRHQFWVIRERAIISEITSIFKDIPNLYIADGHHRSASALRVGIELAEQNPNHTGEEEYNFFLAVLFPHNQLKILDYNRVVKTLNNYTPEEFVAKVKMYFEITETFQQAKPTHKGEFGMFVDKKWYFLKLKPEIQLSNDPIEKLDVSILQNYILKPILGINDPRTDKNIDFIGGIRGLNELQKRVDQGEMTVAFALYPTSIEELISIADAGKIMPPKSTWFEPKLRDGLIIHFLS